MDLFASQVKLMNLFLEYFKKNLSDDICCNKCEIIWYYNTYYNVYHYSVCIIKFKIQGHLSGSVG